MRQFAPLASFVPLHATALGRDHLRAPLPLLPRDLGELIGQSNAGVSVAVLLDPRTSRGVLDIGVGGLPTLPAPEELSRLLLYRAAGIDEARLGLVIQARMSLSAPRRGVGSGMGYSFLSVSNEASSDIVIVQTAPHSQVHSHESPSTFEGSPSHQS